MEKIQPYIRRRASPRISFELDREALLLIRGGPTLEALRFSRHSATERPQMDN